MRRPARQIGHPPTRVVLIGAARSGTKVMRDALARATGAGAVPYDIGYVWRAGDPTRADDVLDPLSLTPRSQRFIAGFVDRYARGEPAVVIEKTVGNTMRVPFVARALPDAVFVHLVRNGVDVAESTFRQWREPVDYRYLAQKVRHFPLRMLPGYGRRYAASLARRRLSSDGRVATWGPRYPGIDADLEGGDLLTVCARQWRESVERARRDLPLTGMTVAEVRYERLVADPAAELVRVSETCGLETTPESLAAAAAMIGPGRLGQGSRSLTDAELMRVDAEAGDLLAELGYDRPRRANGTPPGRST